MELSVFKMGKYPTAELLILIFLAFCSYAPTVFFPKYPLIAPIFSLAILIFYRQFFYKNTGKEFSSVLRYLLVGEGGGFIGIIGFLSELVLLNLLAQYLSLIHI